MFMEYKRRPSRVCPLEYLSSQGSLMQTRMNVVGRMTLFGQAGQAGPGRVSGKELEIADCEPRKVIY
jgi:hypothetical protein